MKSDERMVHMGENQYKSLLETTLNTRDLGDGSSECSLPDIDMNIVIPRESYMNDFLNMLYERYESVDGYFDAIGLDVSARNVIKKKMCGV